MLNYFVNWDDDQKLKSKQLVLQRDVCMEIREHLNVQVAIQDMIMGKNPAPEPSVTDKTDESIANATSQNLLSEIDRRHSSTRE